MAHPEINCESFMKSPPAAFCGFSRPCAQAAMTSGAVLVAKRRKEMQGGKIVSYEAFNHLSIR